MSVEKIPKDVWVIILKQLQLKELVQIRQTCKYINIIVKTKFQRFWFRRYIDLIIRTGNYANKYNINVPKIHKFEVNIEKINLFIPYVTCYNTIISQPVKYMKGHDFKSMYPEEFDLYSKEANEILEKHFVNQDIINENPRINRDNFPSIYACKKLLDNHYHITCSRNDHFVFDLPINENDDEWFDNHKLLYNEKSCYLSHYLITFYRINRDGLDKTNKIPRVESREYSDKKRKLKEVFVASPFYRKTLLKHKVI